MKNKKNCSRNYRRKTDQKLTSQSQSDANIFISPAGGSITNNLKLEKLSGVGY